MLEALLDAIVAEPLAEGRYLVLADWLEEHDDPRRAELLRLHRRLLATCCEPNLHPERAAWQARIGELIGQGVRPCVAQRTVVLWEAVEMTFNFIPPGSFLMGSPEDEEGHQDNEVLHRVTLTRGFFLGTCPVTQMQWWAVTRARPIRFKGNSRPMDWVSWDDCVAFCERLSGAVGERCRLPTEAEWEYACRAGTATPFHVGPVLASEQANCIPYDRQEESYQRTTRVGGFRPNPWGLYDLHGNVWEWCGDWSGPYPQEEVRDPHGPDSGTARVLRGGSWRSVPSVCRSACRFGHDPGYRDHNIGLRVLLCLDGQGP